MQVAHAEVEVVEFGHGQRRGFGQSGPEFVVKGGKRDDDRFIFPTEHIAASGASAASPHGKPGRCWPALRRGLAPSPVLFAFIKGEHSDHGKRAVVDRDGASEKFRICAVLVGPKLGDFRVTQHDNPGSALQVEVGEEASGRDFVLRDGEIVRPGAGDAGAHGLSVRGGEGGRNLHFRRDMRDEVREAAQGFGIGEGAAGRECGEVGEFE